MVNKKCNRLPLQPTIQFQETMSINTNHLKLKEDNDLRPTTRNSGPGGGNDKFNKRLQC